MQADALPSLLCGMIGSDIGWTSAPYQPCPAELRSLAAGLVKVEESPGVWIVPGLRGLGLSGTFDVMRGEETQILGWIAQNWARSSGRLVICHPGTHAKWVLVENGRIVRFITNMTGELFDLLRSHSILRTCAPADDELAFDEGLTAACDGGALAARLFTGRTRIITGSRPTRSSGSYLSGLLIGAEVASMPSLLSIDQHEEVNLIGDLALCRWYARALLHRKFSMRVYNGEDAVITGLATLKEIAGI
jgi:2-dehydro-3-deoxygalactonokinase